MRRSECGLVEKVVHGGGHDIHHVRRPGVRARRAGVLREDFAILRNDGGFYKQYHPRSMPTTTSLMMEPPKNWPPMHTMGNDLR